MEGKLVKLGKDDYILHVNNKPFAYKNLSLKNCQAIENGYDLMKLAEENSHKYYDVKTTDWHCNYNGFFSGFQKALEILGDKKFTKEDMGRIMVYGYDKSTENEYLSRIPFDEYIQSLQQTEWSVTFNPEEKDADGCLILKRK